MADAFFFNGQTYYTPTTASQVNDTGFGPSTLGTGNTVIMVGTSYGGQPNVGLNFSSPAQAKATLISGDLLTAVTKAFAPSAEVGAPSQVMAMVVGQATPATLTLNNSNNAAFATLQTTQYGNAANGTKVKITAGSNSTSGAPSFCVTAQLSPGQAVSQDNIYQAAFTVSYSGAAMTATIQVSDTQVILSAPTGTPVATLSLSAFSTIDQLVDQINGTPGFSAAIGLGATGGPTAAALDWKTAAQDCKTAPYVVTATAQAVIDWINSNACGLLTATRTAGLGYLPALIPWTFLKGATSPAPIVGDWATAFAAMQKLDVQHIATLSADPAVAALGDAHVQYMSTVGRRERRQYTGPALGTTITAAEGLPLAINSDRTAICYPGYKDYDVNGNLITLPSYQSAAIVAAMFAAASPGDAMTHKSVTVRGLEVLLGSPTDTDPLIQAGVLCLRATANGYEVVRSISTWLTNNNFNRVEISCGIAVDYAVRSIRTAVDAVRGGRQGPQLMGLALSIAESILTDLAKPQPQGPGVLVGDANSPAWQNLTASIVDDELLISVDMSPVIPNNFIGVSIGLVPYSGTASA